MKKVRTILVYIAKQHMGHEVAIVAVRCSCTEYETVIARLYD